MVDPAPFPELLLNLGFKVFQDQIDGLMYLGLERAVAGLAHAKGGVVGS